MPNSSNNNTVDYEVLLDEFSNLKQVGNLSDANHESSSENASCGDSISVGLKTEGEGDELRIANIAWQGDGCVISQVTMSVLSDWIKKTQPTVKELKKITEEDLLEMLGLEKISSGRKKCLNLGLEVVRKTLVTSDK